MYPDDSTLSEVAHMPHGTETLTLNPIRPCSPRRPEKIQRHPQPVTLMAAEPVRIFGAFYLSHVSLGYEF